MSTKVTLAKVTQAFDRRAAHLRGGKTDAAASYGFSFQAMSSVCEVRLDGVHDARLNDAAHAAIAEVQRIEFKYSRYRADSIVSAINAAAGTGFSVAVDVETAGLLNFAAQLHALSDGLFDITSGVLRRAWDFKAALLPEAAALQTLLPLIGWGQVKFQNDRISLPQTGMEIDFGGFGKEYAADRAVAVLHEAGQRHGFVNLGGDIRVLGPRVDGSPWRFGIQHPRRDDTTIASVDLTEGALASSGDYERYFEHDGKRYCHILDPFTGWPVSAMPAGWPVSAQDAAWASVSVTAPACVAAGALSTIAMLKGTDALDFLATQQATYLAVDASMKSFRYQADESDGDASSSAAQQFIFGDDE
jgi:FAD:protein FMN transferase